jgi:hypothetical protein
MEEGLPTRRFTVNADLALFVAQRVSIQEGPTLAANKLAADIDTNFDGVYELTSEDLRSHVNAQLLVEALRRENRKPHRRRTSPPHERSPWRHPISKGARRARFPAHHLCPRSHVFTNDG